MVFFTIPSYPGFNFFFFGRTLAAFSVFGECAKIFQQLMRIPQGQYFNHGRRNIMSESQENKMQLKFFACPTGKYHSAYSPYAINELNLALDRKYLHNMKKM
jgi:hypothetical protein